MIFIITFFTNKKPSTQTVCLLVLTITYPDSGDWQGVGNALTAGLRAGLMAKTKTQFCQHSLHIVNKTKAKRMRRLNGLKMFGNNKISLLAISCPPQWALDKNKEISAYIGGLWLKTLCFILAKMSLQSNENCKILHRKLCLCLMEVFGSGPYCL